jgi:hypothetical protein
MPVTATRMTMLRLPAIIAYSIEVAPDSSRKKADASFAMKRIANSDRWMRELSREPGNGNLQANDCTDP